MTVATASINEQPCHTGPAAHTCAFDAALHETDVDTAELLAITCVSCGAPYGGPHNPGCAFDASAAHPAAS